ncbi:MAG: hypothetical protein LBN95_08000 [Prevotellaceae bacterium]|jgi:hypothetical protein|nr:hypothetical protein [Prevotellaceae bacterium]
MKNLTVNLAGTGVKGLRVMSYIMFILLIFTAFVSFFAGIEDEMSIVLMLYVPVASIWFGLINLFVLQALATIAENAKIQKTKLEQELIDNELSLIIE